MRFFNGTALTIALFSMTPALQAHWHSGYAHDSGIGYSNRNWMQFVPDNRHVRKLSLPGTHNSMAHYGGDSVMNQTMRLKTQLESGVRAFDVRLRHINNQLAVHHGLVYQHANFTDVLTTLSTFLRENPSETVLVRTQQEYQPEGNTRSYAATYQTYIERFAAFIWMGSEADPKLQDVRGKIVFLQSTDGPNVGLRYSSFTVQDDYQVSSNWDLYDKWKKVETRMWKAATDGKYSSVNFLTANGGSFPYFIASGHSSPGTGAPRLATGMTTPGWNGKYPDFPRVNCFIGICTIAFEGTNVLSKNYMDWLLDWQGLGRPVDYVGMVFADFPGAGLIDNTIKFNLAACRSWSSADIGTRGNIYRYNNPYSSTTDYFRLRRDGRYWYYPTNQSSNDTWEFLGHSAKCR